ncbi:MAG: DUF3604 domain-containing protein, partial [Promethearchaeota archaeon]
GARSNKNDWYPMQAEDPDEDGFIEMLLEKQDEMHDIFLPIPVSPFDFKFRAMENVLAGDKVVLKFHGTIVQSMTDLQKLIEILVSAMPDDQYIPVSNAPRLKIIGGAFHHARIILHSFIEPDGFLEGKLTFEDRYNNPINLDVPDVGAFTLDLLAWSSKASKLIIIDSFSSVKKILISEVPHYLIRYPIDIEKIAKLLGTRSVQYVWVRCGFKDEFFLSNPVRVMVGSDSGSDLKAGHPDSRKRMYWGVIHAHSELSDGMGSIDDYFSNIRNNFLDFGASSDHDHEWETTDDDFTEIRDAVRRFNDPDGGFITFLGYEWSKWNRLGYGDKCIYFLDDVERMYRSGDENYNHPEKLYQALERHDDRVLVIPHHTAYIGNPCTWEHWDREHERLVEIYSVWGCSEMSVKSGNPRPVRPFNHEILKHGDDNPLDAWEVPDGFVQSALKKGIKVGFTAGGDDHIGFPGGHRKMNYRNDSYEAGLLAVIIDDDSGFSKNLIWNALWNRRCYGTTGARIIADFSVNDFHSGSSISIKLTDKEYRRRIIKVHAAGSDRISCVEIVRNGDNWRKLDFQDNSMVIDVTIEDNECFDEISIKGKDAKFSEHDFVFYHVRILQSDGEMAWLSPVWIELDEPCRGAGPKRQ